MAERKKRPIHITPVGRAVWPKLTRPETKFDADGVYSVKLALPEHSEEAVALINLIEEAMDEALAEGKAKAKGKKVKQADPPYTEEIDRDSEQPTGNLLFSFKMRASGTRKDGTPWTRRPNLYDAHRQPIRPEDVDIWNGTRLRVAYTTEPFYVPALGAGVSLRLQAAQIIELVSGGERDAASYGFEDEEDGYSAPTKAADTALDEERLDEDASAEADF